MKKLFGAAAIVAAAILGSCSNAPKGNLQTDIDTLSYAIGMSQSQGLKPYLAMRMGVDTTKMDKFYQGLIDGAKAGDNKDKAAYFAGVQIGQQIANQMLKGINYELSGNDSTEVADLQNLLAGFIAAVKGENTAFTLEEAATLAQTKMQEVKKQHMLEQYADWKNQCEEYFAKVAKQDSIQTLPSGVMYKVLVAGTGAVPADTSSVKVNYEGKLIDGTIFDSSYKRGEATTFRCNQVIAGWTEALTHMPVGSTWEVYIPQEMAYGERESGLIKPFSSLIFKIELLGIEK